MSPDSSEIATRGDRQLAGRAGAVVGGHVAAVAGHAALVAVDVDALAAQRALASGDDVVELGHSALLLLPRTPARAGGVQRCAWTLVRTIVAARPQITMGSGVFWTAYEHENATHDPEWRCPRVGRS